MAGLLDIFGTGGTETLGLLGMSPADIQRNRDDAQAQALYGLAARLFQGGNTGQSIAEGLQQGQKLYSSAMQNQLQEKLQGVQMADLLEKRKREKEAEARQAMIDRAVTGAYRPAVAAVEAPTPTGPLSGAAFGEVGTPAQAAGFDWQSLAPALMASPQGRKTLTELMAAQKSMGGETTSLAEGAQLVRTNPLTGKVEVVAQGTPKEKPIQFQDLGNVVIGIQNGKEVMRLPKGLSPQRPDAAPSLQTFEGENGMMMFNPKTGQTSPLMFEGKQVPGKSAGMTEDQAKATAWLVQAQNAYSNMNKAIDESKNASSPSFAASVPLVGGLASNVMATGPQQRFRQGASSLSESLLRAATGAGMNENEAQQKIKEITPVIGDDEDTIKQKMDAIPLFIKTLEFRAGKKGTAAASKIVAKPEENLYETYGLTRR